MSEKSFDHVYGNKGVDTSYEQDKISYKPDLTFEPTPNPILLPREIENMIERSQRFTITDVLRRYQELLDQLSQLIQVIENRALASHLGEIRSLVRNEKWTELIQFEKQHTNYDGTGDYEIYSLLLRMRGSIQARYQYIDHKFRTQFTDANSLDEIQQAEQRAIDKWIAKEHEVLKAYQYLSDHHEYEENHTHSVEDESLTHHYDILNHERMQRMEYEKRQMELFHSSLADTAYMHLNRYYMFSESIEELRKLIYHPSYLIDGDVRYLIQELADIGDYRGMQSHLIMEYKDLKQKHQALKGRWSTVDDIKETYVADKHLLHQQLETKANQPIKQWLYTKQSEVSQSLDKFASIMVNSLKKAKESYDTSMAEMLRFYKNESNFYDQQIFFLQKKEEIRRFYRIIKDLEEAGQIDDYWIGEYLDTNGYRS